MSSALLNNALSALAKTGAHAPKALSTVTKGASFKLPDMPYDYGALEPFISADIMKIHHTVRRRCRSPTTRR